MSDSVITLNIVIICLTVLLCVGMTAGSRDRNRRG